MAEPDRAADPACSCKLGRSADAYGLRELDERIADRHADGASLRDLEEFVNEAILRGALRAADADVVGDLGGLYDALRGEDVTAGRRTEVRRRLERAGVDVDALLSDFVSYQTVRTHLQDCLGVDTNRERDLTVADARGTVEWARSRTEGIAERTLERLARADRIPDGEFDVSQVVRVSCTDCGAAAPVGEFLDRGGCDCAVDGDDRGSADAE